MSGNTPGFKASEEILLLLEDAKRKLDHSIDFLPGVYFIIDETGKIYRSNKEFQEKFDHVCDERGSASFFDFLDEENKELLQALMEKASRKKEAKYSLEVDILFGESESYALTLYSWSPQTKSTRQFFTIHGKNISDIKQLTLEKESLQREVRGAEQVQKLMLPATSDEYNNAKLSCFYRSASECGGDFLFYRREEHIFRIWAGDVTGHGVGPAMISGGMRAAISVMQSSKEKLNPLQSMERLNACLHDISNGLYWMTFQILEFDLKKMILKSCQAGHPEVYRLDKKDLKNKTWRDFEPLTVDISHALGMSLEPQFLYQEVPIEKNSIYLSCSDGIFETQNEDEKPFGKRRMFKSLLRSYETGYDVQKAQDVLLKDLNQFRRPGALEDDLSFWSLSIG